MNYVFGNFKEILLFKDNFKSETGKFQSILQFSRNILNFRGIFACCIGRNWKKGELGQKNKNIKIY